MNALAPDPAMLTRRSRDLMQASRFAATRPLIAALRHIAPDAADTYELAARLLQHDNRPRDAALLVSSGIVRHPDCVELRLLRAELRLEAGDFLGGADDAAAAVISARSNPAAKAVLGLALIRLSRFDEAITCLREAVAAAPLQPTFREGYAQALERADQRDAAIATLREGIALVPGHVGLRVAAIMTALRKRDTATAIELAEAARRAGVADARVFGLLGHARSLLEQFEAATHAYMEALKLAPEDPYVRYLVAASGALPSAPRAPIAYVETVFDGYASHFDAHLLSLAYRVPGLIRAALLEHVPALRCGTSAGVPMGPVLDLGCGTGMVATALSDVPLHQLVGIDISSNMLARARTKQLYAELRRQDIEEALDGPCGTAVARDTWALILAADALVYFGDLAAVLRGAFGALRAGGLFVFSIEEWAAAARTPASHHGAWHLGPLGRYAHRAEAIKRLAETTGFEVRAMRQETMRHDRGTDIGGLLVVLARPL